MKKLVLVSIIATLFLNSKSFAQIPNPDFETWNSTSYMEPDTWHSGNTNTIRNMGIVPVTRVTGFSGYAVRIETSIIGTDTSNSYISNSAGDPIQGQGGVPFSQQATAITGYYRYSLPVNDTAIMLVIFKKNGSIISMDMCKIRGTGSQLTFAPFSFPLTLSMVPDSVVIAAASSNLISNEGIQNGSFLELDQLAFAGTTQALQDGDFENWTAFSSDVLSGWETYGDGITKTTDSYTGTYAIQLTTIDYGSGNIQSSGMTTGHNTQSGPAGGTPYTTRVDTLTGYYKYFNSGNDSAMVNVNLMKNSSNVGGNGIFLPSASVYTYFEIPVNAGVTPDTMRIEFSSSKWPYTGTSTGSTLLVDNLMMKSQMTTGISQLKKSMDMQIIVFPNPVQDELSFLFPQKQDGNVLIGIYDFSGRMIKDYQFPNISNYYKIDLSSLSPGVYFSEVISGNSSTRNRFVKQ